jgi:histidyl-tRNA synthetase
MDVVGVPGVEAEAELLAAIVTFFSRVGLSKEDVGIKVSNRKVVANYAIVKIYVDIYTTIL